MIKYLFILLLFISAPMHAQDGDISELEDLEKELETLESEEVGETPEFSENVNASEDFSGDTIDDIDEQGELEDLAVEEAEEAQPTSEENLANEEFAEDLAGEDLEEGAGEEEQLQAAPSENDSKKEAVGGLTNEEGVEEESGIAEDKLEESKPEEIVEETPVPLDAPAEEELVEETPQAQEENLTAQAEAPLEVKPDEPNLRKEREIFNSYQYIQNNSGFTSNWDQVTENRESETYVIQSGDSLWDVSSTLFGNPYFWPKIWSLNSGITNPHKVLPGQQLLFVEGSIDEAPVLTEGESSEDNSTAKAEEKTEEELLAEELPELPAPAVVRPALEKIPPSLGAWHTHENDKDDFAEGAISKVTNNIGNSLRLSSYFVENLPVEEGKIVEIEGNLNSANLFQYVYIQSSSVNVGDRLLAYSPHKLLKSLKGEHLGYPIEVQGSIKVMEQVNADKNVYKALVEFLVDPIKVGSSLLKRGFPVIPIDRNAPIVDVAATIIGAEFDNRRKVLGTGSLVFLDVGQSGSIQVGNRVQVLKNYKVRNQNTYVDMASDVIGIAVIVDVQESRSTALLLESKEQIVVGDKIGSAALISLGSEDGIDQNIEKQSLDQDESLDVEQEIEEEIESESL